MSATVAAISQLVATGAIDQELTKNPTVTYFRYQHFRHTNFAIENQLLQFEGNQTLGNTKASCTLHRSGDLVHKMYCVIDLPGLVQTAGGSTLDTAENTRVDEAYWCNAVGFRLIKEAELLIGSQKIDSLMSDFLFMYHELSKKPQKSIDEMIGAFDSVEDAQKRSKFFRRLHVPLPFFCSKTTGASLPIVALQFHTVTVKIAWNDIFDCVVNYSNNTELGLPKTETNAASTSSAVTTSATDQFQVTKGSVAFTPSGASSTTYTVGQSFSGAGEIATVSATADHVVEKLVPFKTMFRSGQETMEDAHAHTTGLKATGSHDVAATRVVVQLECMYVYLDLDERTKFSSGSFQLLISEAAGTHSHKEYSSSNVEYDLDFNHAVIELMWAVRQKTHSNAKDWFNYGGYADSGVVADPVQNVRLTLNGSERFYTDNNGAYFRTVQPYQHHSNVPKDSFVYSYSFSLFPESENPSGQCNFSRIDSKKLHLTLDSRICSTNKACEVIVFARNWNLLRVTLGLGGKAYAN